MKFKLGDLVVFKKKQPIIVGMETTTAFDNFNAPIAAKIVDSDSLGIGTIVEVISYDKSYSIQFDHELVHYIDDEDLVFATKLAKALR